MPMDGGGVIGESGGGEVAAWKEVREDILVGQGSRELQLGVGDGAGGVGGRDKAAADLGGKRGAPEDGRMRVAGMG